MIWHQSRLPLCYLKSLSRFHFIFKTCTQFCNVHLGEKFDVTIFDVTNKISDDITVQCVALDWLIATITTTKTGHWRQGWSHLSEEEVFLSTVAPGHSEARFVSLATFGDAFHWWRSDNHQALQANVRMGKQKNLVEPRGSKRVDKARYRLSNP